MFIINNNPDTIDYSVEVSTSTILSNAVLHDQESTEIPTSVAVTVIVSGKGTAPNVQPSDGIVILSNGLTSSSRPPSPQEKCIYVYQSDGSGGGDWSLYSANCQTSDQCESNLTKVQQNHTNAVDGQTLLIDCIPTVAHLSGKTGCCWFWPKSKRQSK